MRYTKKNHDIFPESVMCREKICLLGVAQNKVIKIKSVKY